MKPRVKPPQYLIDRMLADKEFGVLTSITALGAALAAKRGGSGEVLSVQTAGGDALPDAVVDRIKSAHAMLVHEFRQRASPDEIDHAIALYSEHLRQAGYVWDVGRSDN